MVSLEFQCVLRLDLGFGVTFELGNELGFDRVIRYMHLASSCPF